MTKKLMNMDVQTMTQVRWLQSERSPDLRVAKARAPPMKNHDLVDVEKNGRFLKSMSIWPSAIRLPHKD